MPKAFLISLAFPLLTTLLAPTAFGQAPYRDYQDFFPAAPIYRELKITPAPKKKQTQKKKQVQKPEQKQKQKQKQVQKAKPAQPKTQQPKQVQQPKKSQKLPGVVEPTIPRRTSPSVIYLDPERPGVVKTVPKPAPDAPKPEVEIPPYVYTPPVLTAAELAKQEADRQANLLALEGMNIESVRHSLQELWTHGLDGNMYWTPILESTYNAGLANDPWFRSSVSAAFLKALKDVSTGTQDPKSIGEDIKIAKKEFMTPDQLKTLVTETGGQADILLEMISPAFAQYRSLREALLRLYPIQQAGGWQALGPFNKDLKFGVRHPDVFAIKERLKIMGYNITIMDDLFDAQVRSAVNDIQLQMKMKPDGVISKRGRTWGYFAVPVEERVRQIQLDLEKLRWLPQNLEERHIYVNTAFSTFLLVDKGQNVTMNFKTVNGRKERKTPTMKDKVVYVVLNPTWTVPPTVFLEDKVQLIKQMSAWEIEEYFWKNQFDIFTPDFKKKLDPTSIDWHNITSSNVNFYIRQRPNYNNALGVVKFMMSNPYAIYLHDTNDRHLFAEPLRTLSSGCVRLEYPIDLAEYLLRGTQWDRYAIETFVSNPWSTAEKETNINLKNPMPVYLMPQTSSLSSDGVIRFTNDVYGHNEILSQRLKGLGN
jgi:murein L,D-transpeptidase YcbB/YkuD